MLTVAILDTATGIYIISASIKYMNDANTKPLRQRLFFIFIMIKFCNFYCFSKYFYYGMIKHYDKKMVGQEFPEEILNSIRDSIADSKDTDQ